MVTGKKIKIFLTYTKSELVISNSTPKLVGNYRAFLKIVQNYIDILLILYERLCWKL